ncbi:hypothetical protein [uncultured Arthrobacter sp.]|uniref:hypothetical protein n=1 Tax=uncultured Arthrobacter sp. TaxID=114050 RepID=UPI0025D24DAA|nr:hypothetical protein [uncultured Arthrobacter sp.]
MADKQIPPSNIIANAQRVFEVLSAYRYYDEGLTSERELRSRIATVLAGADVPLLVTSLAHSTIEFVKRTASARGETVEQVMEAIEDELRPFTDPKMPRT